MRPRPAISPEPDPVTCKCCNGYVRLQLYFLKIFGGNYTDCLSWPADVNGDGAFGLPEYALLTCCIESGGPGVAPSDGCRGETASCSVLDRDGDGDVDLVDFSGLLSMLSISRE